MRADATGITIDSRRVGAAVLHDSKHFLHRTQRNHLGPHPKGVHHVVQAVDLNRTLQHGNTFALQIGWSGDACVLTRVELRPAVQRGRLVKVKLLVTRLRPGHVGHQVNLTR